MAFLRPHFEYDVFVSYSHGVLGTENDTPLKDWTLELIRRLETDIRAVDTEFEVRNAETIARQVANVKDVENNLYPRSNGR